MHVVIVGNSAAGISAAETVRKLDTSAEITLITEEPYPAYLRCLIPEVLAGNRGYEDVCYRSVNYYQKNGITLISGIRVTGIIPESQKIILADEREFVYDRLVVATGASSVPLNIEGENLPGIFHHRTIDQASAAAILAQKAKRAVIIGGGLVGLKAAWALCRRSIKVTIVEKETHLLTRQLDPEAASLIEKDLARLGIEFVYDTAPVSIQSSRDGESKLVALDKGKELSADLIIVSRGVRPNIGLVKEAGGATSYGIVVDKYLSTTIPEVYAAGDCIEIPDAVTGETMPSGLWPLAVEQGRYAAYNLTGNQRAYPCPITNLNAAQIGRVPFVSVGAIDYGDEHITAFDKTKGAYRKLILKEGRLVAFIMSGTVDKSGVYTALVKSGQLIPSDLKNRLLEGTVTAADLIMGIKQKGV